jgi:hypothetical protein
LKILAPGVKTVARERSSGARNPWRFPEHDLEDDTDELQAVGEM